MWKLRAYYELMSLDDLIAVSVAFTVTLALGVGALFLVLWLQEKPKQSTTALKHRGGAPAAKGRQAKTPPPPPPLRRRIPLAAASEVVERGNRLCEEQRYEDALRCYLYLLYSAVEGADKDGVLPAQLVECLRGAASCYRALGCGDDAAKLLQGERLVYEECLAEAERESSNNKGNKNANASRIVSSILSGQAMTRESRRYAVLRDVAEAALRHGNAQLGLSYRVKALAEKLRLSGSALDPESEDARLLAEVLQRCEASSTEEGQSAASSSSAAAVASAVAEPQAPESAPEPPASDSK